MGIDTNARCMAMGSAIGLLFAAIIVAYLNSTTSVTLWSTIYLAAEIGITLVMLVKFTTAMGVDNRFIEYADKVSAVVPFVVLYFCGIQFLHYTRDGLDGFMAFIAIIALGFNTVFGLLDGISTFTGKFTKTVSDTATEISRRTSAVADAASGRRPAA